MKYIFMIVAIIVLFLYTAAAAETPHLLIAQVSASGITADDEFIQLQNPTDQNIDIGSWSIQYKSASGATYYKKNFVKGATIAAGGTYLIAGSGYAGSATPDMKQSTISLSSSGGTVFLVSNQALLTTNISPVIVDQKTYAAESGKTTNNNINASPTNSAPSLANTDLDTNTATNDNANLNQPITDTGSDDDIVATDQDDTVAATPMTTTVRQSDVRLITINEFMPAPSDGKEWIELYDGTGYAVDLGDWTLSDGTGRSFLTLDGLIMPAQFKLVELTSSHLNNSGDLIILRDDQKREIDSVAYGDWNNDPGNAPAGDTGTAVARIGDGRDTNDDKSDFALTASPTPGAANVITAPPATTLPTVKTANSAATATKISKTDTQWLADLLKTQDADLAKLLKADNIIIINNLTINANDAATASVSAGRSSKTVTTTATKSAFKTAATKIATTATKTAPAKTNKPANTAAGMVIVPPNVVGKDICVIREDDRSVEIRLPKDLKTAPVAGDIVAASGTWSTAQTLTLPRLLVSKTIAFAITDHNDPPTPISVPMSRLPDHLGELVSTSGTIVEKQPTRLRIAENDAALLIKTNFAANKGDKLSATGLLVKSGPDLLLTTLTSDALSVIKPPTAAHPSPMQRSLPYALALVPAGILATAVYLGKRLKKKGGETQ